MKRLAPMPALLAACLCFAPAANAAASKPAPVVGATTCDLELNVADPDPKGLNVRASPSAQATIVAVLKPVGDWTTVHVTGQQGHWVSIDRAVNIDDSSNTNDRIVFRGKGWVYASKLGVSELFVGGGTVLRDRPSKDGRILLRYRDEETTPAQILDCNGKYIHVRQGGHVGWTDTWCNNEHTTCV